MFRSAPTRTWTVDVSKAREMQLLDMVAVLHSASDPEIRTRDVGTVVELLPRGALEGEFLSRDGRTRHNGTLSTDDVLILNRERTRDA